MGEIVISGYYGFKNAGDELILKAIISDLRFYKPDIKITVLSANPSETSDRYSVHSVNRWDALSIIKEIAKCKMLVSGSGGLFQDTTGSLSLWYYLLIIAIAKLFKKSVFVYAVGIGEIKHSVNSSLIKYLFNKSRNSITVRTQQDKELLRKFGITKDIIITADPVLGLDILPSARNTGLTKQKIGIILRRTENWKTDIKIFAELYNLLKNNFNTEIIFIPFHLSDDLKFLSVIKNKIGSAIDIFLWKNTDELLELYSQLTAVVSMRLHGLILAAGYNIPFVAVQRYSKIRNFLYTLTKNDNLTNGTTANEIYLQLIDKIKKKESLETITDLKNKSKETAKLCIAVLTDEINIV
ncbi:MAG: polysaccharide pyruvyl transferase CsaB [Elusimicrobiota bacterium]